MGMGRSETLHKRREQARQNRKANKPRKVAERSRRDARMIERLGAGSLPYTPEVMSWLSLKLGKKASRITAEDVAKLTG